LFGSNPCLIAIRSLSDRTYMDVNDSWVSHTGYSRQEWVGSEINLFVPEEGEPDWMSEPAGQPVHNTRIQYRTKRMETRDGLLSLDLIEMNGQPCELYVIVDITDK